MIAEKTQGNLLVQGSLISAGRKLSMPLGGALHGATGFVPRSAIVQEDLVEYAIPFTSMRKHDNYAATLSSTASSPGTTLGHFGLTDTTWSAVVAAPSLIGTVSQNGDPETNYAAFLFRLPPEYVEGETIEVRIWASVPILATPSSGDRVVVDANVHLWDDDGATGSDLVTTDEQVVGLTIDSHRFVVTPTGLTVDDVLAVRILSTVTDKEQTATRKVTIYRVAVALDIKG